MEAATCESRCTGRKDEEGNSMLLKVMEAKLLNASKSVKGLHILTFIFFDFIKIQSFVISLVHQLSAYDI